ncbi:MAG TPA: winged helix-turn-helix domain-containing protein [Candidatus Baltobacteraceae bacterium]|jgi:DNA-binding winged helix-turn-helix (wHTH) protein/tetratricopeptide (TPR) repeat protein
MSLYQFGPFELDAEQLLLSVAGVPVALGPKVVETLLALLEHPGEVLSKSALLDRVWPDGFVEEANLAQNIYVLRKTLRAHWDADAIATVSRRGYRFVGEVRLVERAPSAPIAAAAVQAAGVPRRSALRRWGGAAAALAATIVLAFFAISSNTSAHLAGGSALSPKGARLYAIGRYYWNQRTEAGVTKSLAYFTQVVDTDPRDARGYAALADANAIMADYGYGSLKSPVYMERAHAYAQKALALDADSAEAYAVLGMIDSEMMSEKVLGRKAAAARTARGIAELRRSIALDASYGPAHEWYGIALLEGGRAHDALRELQAAANLDPLSISTTAWLSSAAYLDRQYDEAIAYAHQAIDLAPSRPDVWQNLGLSYEARGDRALAIATYKIYATKCASCATQASALLAHAYAVQHEMPLARAALAKAQADPNAPPSDIATALAAFGERTSAFVWLRRMHGYPHALIALDPRLDVLRQDARFRDFVQSPA